MKKMKTIDISLNKNKGEKKRLKKGKEDESLSKGIDIVNKHKDNLEKERKGRIGKTLVEVKEEYIENKEEEVEYHSSLRKLYATIFIVLIIVCIYLFLYYGPILGVSLYKADGINEENRIDIVSTDEDIYKMYCSDLLVYSNRVISTYNKYGKKTWEYTLEDVFTPNIYIYDKYMAITNSTNGTIYLFENKKEILNKKVEGQINGVYIDENGNMAVEHSTNGYKRNISIYNKGGSLVYNIFLNSDSIIDIKLLNNAKKLLILETDASSFTISTVLNIVDCTKQEDNIEQITKFDNNLVYDIILNNKEVILLLDNKIVKLNLNTKVLTDIKTFDSTQMLFVALSNNYYSYVEKKLGNDNAYNIQTCRYDSSSIASQSIDNSPKSMKNTGLLNYFIYQNKLQVINKWGVEIKNIELAFPPKDIIVFNKERTVGLVYANKIYIVNM